MISNSKYNQRIKNYSTSPKKRPEILGCFLNASNKATPYLRPSFKNSTLTPSPNKIQQKKTKKLSLSVQSRNCLITPEDEEILNDVQKIVPKAPILNSPKKFSQSSSSTPSTLNIYLRTEKLQTKLKSWKDKRKKLENRYSLLLQEMSKSQKIQEKVLENLRLKLSSQNSFQN